MPSKRYIDVAESAKMIRTLLKAKFVGVKFSVKSSRYAGGASIDIKWENGPTKDAVRKYTDPFAGARFDGMIDMQSYVSSVLLADGTVVHDAVEPLPEGAERVSFGSDYVHCQRTFTFAFVEPLVEEYKKNHGDGRFVKLSATSYGPRIDIEPWDYTVQQRVGRFIEETSEHEYNNHIDSRA